MNREGVRNTEEGGIVINVNKDTSTHTHTQNMINDHFVIIQVLI